MKEAEMYVYYFGEGAILRAKTPGILPDHLGIAGRRRLHGVQEVIHSRPPFGVQVTTLEEFAKGRHVEAVCLPDSPEHGQEVLARAYSQIGRPWTLTGNCEHFASWAFSGGPDSPQLREYIAGACAFVLVAAVLTRNGR
ncbi:MAG: hypothetical protein DMG21_01405 [Acidobacteria bacterium]|nr:MAG: hypothetical protein DMG21_01405 [Acidobacteriota bacterium]